MRAMLSPEALAEDEIRAYGECTEIAILSERHLHANHLDEVYLHVRVLRHLNEIGNASVVDTAGRGRLGIADGVVGAVRRSTPFSDASNQQHRRDCS